MRNSGGRREATPAEMLEGLRRARDYYGVLADRIGEIARNPAEARDAWQAWERKARRFARAYERSFNIQYRMMHSRMGAER